MRLRTYIVFIALLCSAFGCSRRPQLYTVTGTVSLDGKPLPDGDILFVDSDGALGPNPGKIKNGQFELQATAGKKRVEISASRIFPGGARGAGGEPVPEEFVPERYNTKSILKEEVTVDGKNYFEFKLVGGKK